MAKKKRSKKTPEQKKAARQAGWQQFKQGAKAKYYEIPRDAIAGAITGGIKSIGVGDKKSMVKGAIEGSVTDGIVKRNIDATKDMVVGALKGIFNHPDWYKFNGKLPTLAINTRRPFDPKSVYPVMDTLVEGGVSNLSLVTFKYNDVIDNPAFKYAARELYQVLRLNLKSNLIESQTDIEYYLAQAIELTVRLRSIEKRYGLIHAKDADIPDLDIQLRMAPSDYTEIGLVDSIETLNPSAESYADALARFPELKTLAEHITIPAYLNQYISWFINGVFVDQSSSNKMYYTNAVRYFVKHSISQTGSTYSNYGFSRTVTGYIDLLQDTVPALISDINNFLDTVGLVRADLEKVTGYEPVIITDPKEYKFVFAEDMGYFNMLENAYGELPNDIFEDLLRIDFMDGLPEENRIGTLNGLNGALASRGYTPLSPFEVVSQAILFHVQKGETIPMTQGVVTSTTTEVNNSQIAVKDYYWYQYTSNLSVENTSTIATGSETTTVTGSSANQYTFNGDVASINTMKFNFDATGRDTYLSIGSGMTFTLSGTHYKGVVIGTYVTGDVNAELVVAASAETATGEYFSPLASLFVRIAEYGQAPTNYINLGTFSGIRFAANDPDEDLLIKWVNSDYDWGGAVIQPCLTVQGSPLQNIKDDILSVDLTAVVAGRDYTTNDILNSVLTPTTASYSYSYTLNMTVTGAASVSYNQFAYNALIYFLHNLDHAIPITLKTNSNITLVSGTSVTIDIADQTTLIKEVRIPTFINFNDLYNAQYWMYMGLFMNSFITKK